MSLRIRFRGGPLAGETFAFGDDVERIVIGRDPDRCDVVLPPDLTVVGREHLALKRSLARYRVILNRDNPVFVDGAPVLDDTELPEVATLRLGEGGPELVVQTVGASSVPPTEYHGEAPQDIQEIVTDTLRRTRSNRAVAVGIALGLVALAVAIVWAVRTTKRDVRTVAEEQARQKGLLEEKSKAIDELTDEYRGTTQDLRSRLEGVGSSLDKITPDLTALGEAVAGIGPRMEGLEARLRRARPRIQQVLTGAAPSTYVVVVIDPRGIEHATATAWVVEGGRLATNAHVAEIWEQLQKSGTPPSSRMIVRSPGATPRDHDITGVMIHPGYTAFLELWREYRPTGMDPQGQLHGVRPAGAACDVALLDVTDEDTLAPPLPLAPQAVLEAMAAGDVVGLVGYPSEDLSLGGVNLREPTPTTQIAHVTAMTNYFLATAEAEDRHLVQHALPVTGGASGSPILNDDGQVVAVLSAGNIEITPLGDRAPSAVLVNFAQRVDLVRELVEDRADTEQTPRTEKWRKGISTLMSLQAAAEMGARGFLDRYLELIQADAGVEPELLEEWAEAVDGSAAGSPWRAVKDRAFEIPEAGIYVFFAFAVLGQDIDLAVIHETDDAQIYGRETSRDWYSPVRLAADAPAKVRLRVTGPRDAEFRVLVYRFTP